MITTNPFYDTANARRDKKPLFVIEIDQYCRAFWSGNPGSAVAAGLPAWTAAGSLAFTPASSNYTIDGSGLFPLAPAGSTLTYYGEATHSVAGGSITRWRSRPLSGGLSGYVGWTCQSYVIPGGVTIGNASIECTVASSGSVFHYVEFSLDNGATWQLLFSGTGGGAGVVDITSQVAIGFDTGHVKWRFHDNSTTFWDVLPGIVQSVSGLRVVINYVQSKGINPSGGCVSGGGGLFYPWLVSIDDLALIANDLEGSADLGNLVFNVQDKGQAITADMASFVFEGKQIRLLQGWGKFDPANPLIPAYDPIGCPLADYVTLFVGLISTVESDNSNQEYRFTVPDIRQEFSKVVFTTGDLGGATNDSNPRTVTGHPLDILVYILETEIGINPADIDLANIQSYRDGLYLGVNFRFSITSPPEAKEFIDKELLMPLGAFHYTNNLGQVAVSFFYPNSLTPVLDLNDDNVLEIPTAGEAEMFNQISIRYDYDGQNFLSEQVRVDLPSQAKYGLFGQHIIESKGMQSAYQAGFLGALVSFLLFLRYGLKALCFGDQGSSSTPLTTIWDAFMIEPGDIVSVTLADVPDRATGVFGITAKTFVCLGRTWQFGSFTVLYSLVAVDLTPFKQYLITPNAQGTYVASTSLDRAKYLFQCNNSDQYSNGSPANTLA